MSRILLLHASVGTGHKRAAGALRAAFDTLEPDQVRVVDVLDYTSALFRLAYAQSWIELTNHAPLVWGFFYQQTNEDPELADITNNIRKQIESIGTTDLKEVLTSFAPDAIICTHFLPMELLVRLRRKDRLSQPIYCVITDYAAHTFWTYDDIDGYFVGDEQTRAQLVARGVDASKVMVSGIPTDPAIAAPRDALTVRHTRKLSTSGFVITLFGGGVDDDRVSRIVSGLVQSGIEGTLVVVSGRNPTLVSSLASLQQSSTMKLRILGFVTYVDDLVAASDLVITKAGGLIVSEILCRGVPMVLIDPIPGQEEWNADFVVSNGAGVQLRMVDSVPHTVEHLLRRPHVLEEMQANARAIAKPEAAHDIAVTVLDALRG